MNIILDQVKIYLTQSARGEAEMSEEIIEEFGIACKDMLRARFSKQDRKYTMRMSSIGRPLCQQQREKKGTERAPDDYNTPMNFLIGDMIEASAVAIMRGAGVNIDGLHTPVSVNLKGQKIDGTLDVTIDGVVWDIKSCSDYAFKYKFNHPYAFEKINEDDAFGYIPQGYLYANGAGKPSGGWIAISKYNGEWTVAETPIADRGYSKAAIKQVENNITALENGDAPTRCFTPIKDAWRGKETDNTVLGINCVYCSYKHDCWDNLVYAANPKSQAANPSKKWYVGTPK